MQESSSFISLPAIIKRKPLQTGKFVGILLAVILAVAGFLRVVNARSVIEGPLLGDGQFLALVLLPIVSLGLVSLVLVETVVSGYRAIRSEHSLSDQIAGRAGYLALRGAEAGFAVLGVLIMGMAVPSLVAESTPAPVGVGIMLLLFVVGLGILVASFIRSIAELTVYSGAT